MNTSPGQRARKGSSVFEYPDLLFGVDEEDLEPQRPTTGSMTPIRTTEKPTPVINTRKLQFSRPDTPQDGFNFPPGTKFRIKGVGTELHFISQLNSGEMLLTDNQTNELVWILPSLLERVR